MYDELIKRLRASCESCKLWNGYKCCFKGECTGHTRLEAANAIEELANKLCDWCGVCPKERRRPWDCEIMFPDMQVPEVSILPPKEET